MITETIQEYKFNSIDAYAKQRLISCNKQIKRLSDCTFSTNTSIVNQALKIACGDLYFKLGVIFDTIMNYANKSDITDEQKTIIFNYKKRIVMMQSRLKILEHKF